MLIVLILSFLQNVKRFRADSQPVDLTFASLYRKLIHSPSLSSILNVEHAYALAVQDLSQERDHMIAELERRYCQNGARGGGVFILILRRASVYTHTQKGLCLYSYSEGPLFILIPRRASVYTHTQRGSCPYSYSEGPLFILLLRRASVHTHIQSGL